MFIHKIFLKHCHQYPFLYCLWYFSFCKNKVQSHETCKTKHFTAAPLQKVLLAPGLLIYTRHLERGRLSQYPAGWFHIQESCWMSLAFSSTVELLVFRCMPQNSCFYMLMILKALISLYFYKAWHLPGLIFSIWILQKIFNKNSVLQWEFIIPKKRSNFAVLKKNMK